MQLQSPSLQFWNPDDVRQSLQQLRDWNINATQWEPVVATVEFPVAVGPPIVIPSGTTRTALLDKKGDGTNSGLVQTPADATFFDGKVPNGQVILLQSFGLSIAGETLDNIAATNMGFFISVVMQLRQRPIEMGGVQDWPSVEGATGFPGNGNQIVGAAEFDPVILQPLDDLTVTFRAEADVPITLAAAIPRIRLHMNATRFYTERVLGLS